MTPADLLARFGLDPNMVALTGPRLTLGEALNALCHEQWLLGTDAGVGAVDSLVAWPLQRALAAAEAKHRRHLARLKCRHDFIVNPPHYSERLFGHAHRASFGAALWVGASDNTFRIAGPAPEGWARYLAAEARAVQP